MTVAPASTLEKRINSVSLVESTMARSSALRHAAVDGEVDAGDVGAFIGGEERDGRGDLPGQASAAHRDLRGELRGRLLGLFGGEARRGRQGRGVDGAGAHAIHADPA